MALVIEQQPTSPNVTGTELLFTVTSPSASMPQFRYVTDIYESGSMNLVTRLKTYPNRYGKGVIDIGRALQDHLSYPTDEYYEDFFGTVNPLNNEAYTIDFGMEFADSISGSLAYHTGSQVDRLNVFKGIVDHNQGSYNFPSGSFVPYYNGTSIEGYFGDQALSNDPYKLTAQKAIYPWVSTTTAQPKPFKIVNHDDWETVTVLNGKFDDPNVFQYQETYISLYSGSVVLASEQIVGSNLDFNQATGTISIPAGPLNLRKIPGNTEIRNLLNLGPDSWTHYVLGVQFANNAQVITPRDGYWFINDRFIGDDSLVIDGWNVAEYQYDLINNACTERTRFLFMNKYGVTDYFSIYNPVRKVTEVSRNNYTRPFVSYENCLTYYDIANRGETQYYTEYTDKYQITTDWLDEPMANWITELLESPEVNLQEVKNGQVTIVPIVITNATYIRNNDTSRNKLFQYVIEFAYANQRYPR